MNGYIAGVISGLVPFTINSTTKAFDLNTVLWMDYFSKLFLGRTAATALESVYFIIIQFLFLGLLGSFFAMLIPKVTKKFLWFKGIIYGLLIWFVLFTLPYLLEHSQFEHVSIKTPIVHTLAATLWGLTLAVVLEKVRGKQEE
jgi:Na+/proline symporter